MTEYGGLDDIDEFRYHPAHHGFIIDSDEINDPLVDNIHYPVMEKFGQQIPCTTWKTEVYYEYTEEIDRTVAIHHIGRAIKTHKRSLGLVYLLSGIIIVRPVPQYWGGCLPDDPQIYAEQCYGVLLRGITSHQIMSAMRKACGGPDSI